MSIKAKCSFQSFPVEEIAENCYTANGANTAQDAAEKGAPICHTTNVQQRLELERNNIEFLDFISYCLDYLEKGQSVQTIWTGYQEKGVEHVL